jgi:hypothetical protein
MKILFRFTVSLVVILAAISSVMSPPVRAMNKPEMIPCTIENNIVSMTVGSGSVNYGILALGSTQDTTGGGVNSTQIAANSGDAAVDFNIQSSQAVRAAGVDWNLAAAAGVNQFTLKCSTDGGLSWTPLTNSYQVLAADIAPGNSQNFDLQIGMPSSVTDPFQHTVTVTVQAVEHAP